MGKRNALEIMETQFSGAAIVGYRVAAKKEAEAKQVEVHPEEVTGGTKVWLSIQEDTVKLTSDYEARLVNIIHSLPFKMKWDGYRWNYKVESFRGTAEAIVAELGNRFLSNGYIVIFPDKEMQQCMCMIKSIVNTKK